MGFYSCCARTFATQKSFQERIYGSSPSRNKFNIRSEAVKMCNVMNELAWRCAHGLGYMFCTGDPAGLADCDTGPPPTLLNSQSLLDRVLSANSYLYLDSTHPCASPNSVASERSDRLPPPCGKLTKKIQPGSLSRGRWNK